uniref:Chromo domain-containing protein n=1 Tax=viral metagenome TaxID=1070528 RepID=A0A6C0HH61_9ZZZZ
MSSRLRLGNKGYVYLIIEDRDVLDYKSGIIDIHSKVGYSNNYDNKCTRVKYSFGVNAIPLRMVYCNNAHLIEKKLKIALAKFIQRRKEYLKGDITKILLAFDNVIKNASTDNDFEYDFEYEIEKVVGHEGNLSNLKSNKLKLYIKWTGHYTDTDNTWEPYENIKDLDIVKEYREQQLME